MTNPSERISQENLLEQHGVVYCPECGEHMQQYRQSNLLGGEATAGYQCKSCGTYLDRMSDDHVELANSRQAGRSNEDAEDLG